MIQYLFLIFQGSLNADCQFWKIFLLSTIFPLWIACKRKQKQRGKINLRSHFYRRPLFLKRDSSYVLWYIGWTSSSSCLAPLKLIVRPNNNKIFSAISTSNNTMATTSANGHPRKLDHWKG